MEEPRVLVTGGGRGIGRAIALRFAREGASVVVAARTSTELDSVAAEIERAGGRALAAQMDVREHGSVEAAVFRALQFFEDTIDVLVNNAGAFGVAPIERIDFAKWRAMFEVNVDGAMYVTRECLDGLRASSGAHVFNVASRSAKRGFSGETAYCATKYALRGFGDALREELRPSGIRVSTVYPGPTDTRLFDGVPGTWDRSKMNAPEDVAEVVWNAWKAPAGAPIDDLDVPPPS